MISSRMVSQDQRSKPPPGGYTTTLTMPKLLGESLCKAQRIVRTSSFWPELRLLHEEGEVVVGHHARMLERLGDLADRSRFLRAWDIRGACNCGDAKNLKGLKFCKHVAALGYELIVERCESFPGMFVVQDLGIDLHMLLYNDSEDERILAASRARTCQESNSIPKMWGQATTGTASNPIMLAAASTGTVSDPIML